jgi:hypothetical protein
MSKAELTWERLTEILDCDPVTGVFRWKKSVVDVVKSVRWLAVPIIGSESMA